MKIKGISIVEQHIEKIVLGVAVLALIGVAAWQFIGRPNMVTMGGGSVEPGRVDPMLEERAEAVARRLRDDAPAPEEFRRPVPKISAEFEAALSSGVSDGNRLPRLASGIGNRLLPIDLGGDTWYFEPTIPAPAILADVVQTADAIDESAIRQFPELAARFPDPTAPKDIIWTTPAAVLNPAAIMAELRRALPDGSPPRAQVPSPWYNEKLYAVDVVFWREELLPDGGFGRRAMVATIPGQFTMRPRLAGTPDAAVRNDIFARLADPRQQQALLQPPFLATRNGAFVPPALPRERSASESNAQADQLAELISRLKADRDRRSKELEAIGGPLEDQPRGRDGTTSPGGGAGSGGGAAPPGGSGLGGGMTGDRGGAPAGEVDERTRTRRVGLTRALRQLEERLARLEEELKQIAPEVVAESAGAGGIDLSGDEPIIVWAHDIDVVPGRTYRYQAQLRVYNPFFARKRQLVAEQQPLADLIVFESAPSEWSRPVEVASPVTFYVTRASPGEGPLGLGTVRVEVYRLYDGKWRREEFTASPGDRIGRIVDGRGGRPPAAGSAEPPRAPIDFGTDWYIVDIVEDQTAERRTPTDGQKPAIVVIQRRGGGPMEFREPLRETADENRRRLDRDWRIGTMPS